MKQTKIPSIPLSLDDEICTNVYNVHSAASNVSICNKIEIALIIKGNGIHRVLNQDIPCRDCEIYIVNANIPHGYFVNESGESMTIRRIRFDAKDWFDGSVASVDSERFCYSVFRDNSIVGYAMLNTAMQNEIYRLFDAISEEAASQHDEYLSAIRAHLSLLLITIGRYINGAIKSLTPAPPKEWGLVSSVIHCILDNYSDNTLTLENISSELFVSTSQLSRLFKRLTGNSFSEYLRTVRLSHACRLLCETELTVEEIVFRIGMKDIPSFYRIFSTHIDMTPNQYRIAQKAIPTNSRKEEKNMSILSEISIKLQAGKAKIVKELVQQAIDEGFSAETILKEGLVAGMNVVGEKFKNNEVFVPEVLVAARAMNQGAALLKPLLVQEGVKSVGRVCIGTVHGDLHDIGKNIVKMMLEGKGFEVVDLGTDVPAEVFVNTAIEQNCQIICCSALLTTTMGVMADVVKKAEEAGIRDKVKIMIGGAPVSEDFCREIGADAYTADAASCADQALAFCQ